MSVDRRGEEALVLSRHATFLPLGPAHFLCGHAFRGPCGVIDVQERARLELFREPLAIHEHIARDAANDARQRELSIARLEVWRRQGLLVEAGVDEDAQLRAELAPLAAAVAAVANDAWRIIYVGGGPRVSPAVDALVELGAQHGCDIQASASGVEDLAAIAEQRPDFVVIGELPRVGLGFRDHRPVRYVEELRALLREVRLRTDAPILVHNVPVPACSLGGLADRGPDSQVNKVRTLDIAISALAEELDAVHVVDVDQALSLAGKIGLVDDMVPPLAARYVAAGEELRVMRALRGFGRRKVVVVDLDETLWPGVLAETGAPFPPHLPADVYPHQLYLGLHEALLALRDRGILLACVSKNDEDVVSALWSYPSTLDDVPKLTLRDFATYRINWNDKSDNILAIAEELNLGVDTFAFIDDNPHERERVRARLPGVMILGDHPFRVRWQLLTDPAFQVPHVTDEARRRSEMVRGQLDRERARNVAPDRDAFVASLEMRCTIRRETDERNLARIVEMVHRTTQLNTTGEKPTPRELRSCTLYTLAAVDRFADYGLVGVCITEGSSIRQLVLSCRVIGLGLEQVLLRAAAADVARRTKASVVEARLITTPRNHAARHVFASGGFARDPDDPTRWSIAASACDEPETRPFHVTRHGFD